MQCNQVEYFSLKPKVPKIFKHKTVNTIFIKLLKIPYTIHTIKKIICEYYGPPTILQSLVVTICENMSKFVGQTTTNLLILWHIVCNFTFIKSIKDVILIITFKMSRFAQQAVNH